MPAAFARIAYPYQVQGWHMQQRSLWAAHCATDRHVLDLMHLWARQSGKNTLAGVWDATWCVQGGRAVQQGQVKVEEAWRAVHAAPTYEPGIAVHQERLEFYLTRAVGKAWSKKGGRTYRVGLLPATIRLASANKRATRRGATASAYMRLDEVQSTTNKVWDEELEPMVGSTGAPTFFQGTLWPDSLQQQLHQSLLKLEEQDKMQRVLRVPWTVVAELNEAYDRHVRKVIDRLGHTALTPHPAIQTEYELVYPDAVGAFLTEAGLSLLLSSQHPRGDLPRQGCVYVAGVDFCGAAEEPDETALDPEWTSKRDNTCVRIGKLGWGKGAFTSESGLVVTGERVPVVQVVDMLLLPGQPPEACVDKIEAFLRRWRVCAVVGDGRGVGDGPSASLARRFNGTLEVRPGQTWRTLKSSVTDVTRMGFRLLGAINSGRLKLWAEEAPSKYLLESIKQYRYLRKEAREGGHFIWGHPKRSVAEHGKVHDDIPKADGYLLEAAYDHLAHTKPQVIIPQSPFDDAAGYPT